MDRPHAYIGGDLRRDSVGRLCVLVRVGAAVSILKTWCSIFLKSYAGRIQATAKPQVGCVTERLRLCDGEAAE